MVTLTTTEQGTQIISGLRVVLESNQTLVTSPIPVRSGITKKLLGHAVVTHLFGNVATVTLHIDEPLEDLNVSALPNVYVEETRDNKDNALLLKQIKLIEISLEITGSSYNRPIDEQLRESA